MEGPGGSVLGSRVYGLVLGSGVYSRFRILCLLREMLEGKTHLCCDFGSIHTRHAAAKKRIFSTLHARGTLSSLNCLSGIRNLSGPTHQASDSLLWKAAHASVPA